MNACGGAVRGQHDLRPPFVRQLRPHRRLWTVAADTASAGSWGGEVGTRGLSTAAPDSRGRPAVYLYG